MEIGLRHEAPLRGLAGALCFLLIFAEPSRSSTSKPSETSKKTLGGSAQSAQTVSVGTERDNRGNPTLALTFDDGPHPVFTPQLLDILAKTRTKATFYVLGSLVKKHPEIVRRMVEEGHEVGNHTWNHPDLRKLSGDEIRRELQRTEDEVLAACGKRPFSMRPPYGAINQKVVRAVADKHRPIVLWTVDPLDWKKPGASIIAQRLIDGAKPGAILLCHDIHPETVEATKTVVQSLLDRGYSFSTVSEILTRKQSLDLDLDHDP